MVNNIDWYGDDFKQNCFLPSNNLTLFTIFDTIDFNEQSKE